MFSKMFLISSLCFSSIMASGDISISNSCKELSITKIEYTKHKTYSGGEKYGISYGLKNTSTNPIKYKVTIYPKDKDGNRIGESNIGSGTLKAHYEEPFDPSLYYPVGENMSSFSGDADLDISCKRKIVKKHTKTGSQDDTITLKKSAFKMFKGKSDFEASIMAGTLLRVIDNQGGIEEFMKKVKPCLSQQKQ